MADLFTTYDQAISYRDQLLELIDAQSERGVDDQTYIALQALYAQVVASVPGTDQALPRQVALTLPITLPSLVVAYNAYEDASRAEEIVSRNNIRHPGFVPGGRALTVLSNA